MYCGNAIWPHNEEGLENLARYIIRASFSQERMTYIAADKSADGTAKVIYESKDAKTSKTLELMGCQAQTACARSCGTSAFGGARQLKPLSSMMNPHHPARMIT